MGSFHIITEHGYEAKDEVQELSLDPYWILVVYRYSEPLTSSKQLLFEKKTGQALNISFHDDLKFLTEASPLIIGNDCLSVTVSSNKASYINQLQAVLKSGSLNYLSLIVPGDWICCWMMNGEDRYQSVLDRINKGKAANGFSDGLKFVGKVHDIRKVLTQTPNGLKTLQYNLSGTGFSELDSSIYFDPYMTRNYRGLSEVLASLSIPLADIYKTAAEDVQSQGGVDINRMLEALITAYLGKGIRGTGTESAGMQKAYGAAVATKDAPFAYAIPEPVAHVLGIQDKSKGHVHSYADILYRIRGIQHYQGHDLEKGALIPNGTSVLGSNTFYTDKPLDSMFMPTPNVFDNRSLWSLLSDYLNPAINEMYTAVKYCPNGSVMPTLVVRQLPFSSPVVASHFGDDVTAFHELPRWVAAPVLIRGLDVGRSDAARTNFVQIMGATPPNTRGVDKVTQAVKNPPISDLQDVKRHGFRPSRDL